MMLACPVWHRGACTLCRALCYQHWSRGRSGAEWGPERPHHPGRWFPVRKACPPASHPESGLHSHRIPTWFVYWSLESILNLGLEIKIYFLENTCLELEMGPTFFALWGSSFCTKCLCLGYRTVKYDTERMHNKHCLMHRFIIAVQTNSPDALVSPSSEKASVSIDIF